MGLRKIFEDRVNMIYPLFALVSPHTLEFADPVTSLKHKALRPLRGRWRCSDVHRLLFRVIIHLALGTRGPAGRALGAPWLQDHLRPTHVVFSLSIAPSHLSSPRAASLLTPRANTLGSHLGNFLAPEICLSEQDFTVSVTLPGGLPSRS